MANPNINDILAHARYNHAQGSAFEYVCNPGKLNTLIEQATERMESSGRFAKVLEDAKTACRMVVAVIRREYTEVSWETVLLIIGAALYVVSPVDLIPDVILGIGWLDDATLLGWTLKSINDDLERFRAWEASRQLHIGQQTWH